MLYDRYAKKEIREQVIRADRLSDYIRKSDSDPKKDSASEKEMEALAHFFLGIHKIQNTDYTAKYRETLEAQNQLPEASRSKPDVSKDDEIVCPKCGSIMIRRKASKGLNAGKEFYGCSNYPKCRSIINIQ